jgi:hypothetical protein
MVRLNPLRIKSLFLFFTAFTAFAEGQTIATAIQAPDGYTREKYSAGTYSNWVQSLPLKECTVIIDYAEKRLDPYSFYNIFAVVDMPLLFHSDLEQCADYCMRFWAEYHKEMNKLDSLYLFDYSGNKKRFAGSEKTYIEFLRQAFAYANSYSLKKGCKEVEIEELMPGDMIVQNKSGCIGHVSLILDVCESGQGKKLYLIGYSFMPAQEFHIEKADEVRGVEGWFTIEGYFEYLSEVLPFGEPILRRF